MTPSPAKKKAAPKAASAPAKKAVARRTPAAPKKRAARLMGYGSRWSLTG